MGAALDRQNVAKSKELHALIGIVRWLLLQQQPLIHSISSVYVCVCVCVCVLHCWSMLVICYFCHLFSSYFQMPRYEPGDEVQVTVLDEQHPWGQDQKLGTVILKNFEPWGFEGWRPLYHGAWLKVAIFMSHE